MKANVLTEVKKLFACPECGHAGYDYTHVSVGGSFGVWHCDACGGGVTGVVGEDGSVEIERSDCRKLNTLVLLRLYAPLADGEPVYIVIRGMALYTMDEQVEFSRDEYLYDEHTCPWNYLRLPIILGDDTDPHGIFVHQETIVDPYQYSGDGELGAFESFEEVQELFSTLRGPETRRLK